MSETLHPALEGLSNCGCCAGVRAETPAAAGNREGLERIHYRTGDYARFRRTMLAALTESGRQKLRLLTTRANDDFSIAVVDAWAMTADVLTFYQERLFHEGYLRTAVDFASVLGLARLIGYMPKPGVSANAWLAFTLESSPGAPDSVLISTGSKVQSVPGQDEKPQVFETSEDLTARVEWNFMRPRMTEAVRIEAGLQRLHLQGISTQLRPGDAVLLVGDERKGSTASQQWSVRLVEAVAEDPLQNRSTIELNKALEAGRIPQANLKVFALRQKAALFGHNSPDANLISAPSTAISSLLFDTASDGRRSWKNYAIQGGAIDLDAVYSRVIAGSWVVLIGDLGGVMLYLASSVSFPSRASFSLSGKVTRIKPDTFESLSFFTLTGTTVHAQSEELAVASPPLTSRTDDAPSKGVSLEGGTLAPIEGTRISLGNPVSALGEGKPLVVTGKRSRVRVSPASPPLLLAEEGGSRTAILHPGDSLIALRAPAVQPRGSVSWRLRHEEGWEGTLTAPAPRLLLTQAWEDDEAVSEQVAVLSTVGTPPEISLAGEGLQNIYDRATVAVYGNVVEATHGETVEEFAGSGDASRVFQDFTLRQSPLTYVRSDTSFGMSSTLEVRVDDVLWREAPAFYGRLPEERLYIARPVDEEKTQVRFGDGVTGARLPSGQQNVRFRYRKGGGLEGLVRSGQLSQLLTRPLGVKEATNPLPAEGADEPESLSAARENAPLSVLTLERVVSLQDYEDYTRAYPGIAKALATWTWDGRRKGVLLTVAGPEGAAIPSGGGVSQGLLGSLRTVGDPFVDVRIVTYRQAGFEVAGTVLIHPDYEKKLVIAAVQAALRAAFSFSERHFGQPVGLSEIVAVIHANAGVAAVDIDHLQRSDGTGPVDPAPRLVAELPRGGAEPSESGAELLVVDAESLKHIEAAS